jgi:uncharacterized protein
MRVAELWRFPVKSLRGERVVQVRFDERGVDLDRWWSVRGADGRFGSGKTTRRFRRMPGLLTMRSSVDADGIVWVEVPDGGGPGRVDDPATASRVAAVVREPISLATEADVRHHDVSPVHLLTTSSVAWLAARLDPTACVDPRRFRPNILVDTGAVPDLLEEGWAGRAVRIGDVELAVTEPAERCVMTAQAQEELPLAPSIVSELQRANDLNLGVYATVVSSGSMREGDEVVVI